VDSSSSGDLRHFRRTVNYRVALVVRVPENSGKNVVLCPGG
jgi:hypothetical protein